MKNFAHSLALTALAAVAALCPASGRAQQGLYEVTAEQMNRALHEYVPNSAPVWSPAAKVAEQYTSPEYLTVKTDTGYAHIMPLAHDTTGAVTPAASGPLTYHGGPVMQPSVTIYPIFWTPSKLQTGQSTGLTSHYEAVQYTLLSNFLSQGLPAIMSQYKQGSGAYVQNKGGLGKAYVDTIAYPASGCSDAATPGNCLTDAAIQNEVKRVMKLTGLTGGLTKIFMVFTATGEGSCLPGNGGCAYTAYCAYHSYFKVGTTPVIYSNEPYGLTKACQISGAPSPNGDAAADAAATSASHELSEAMTDPELNAWFNSGGEIGDLCAYKYGPLTWDGGRANQSFNGHYFLLQTEYDNHAGGCYQVGP